MLLAVRAVAVAKCGADHIESLASFASVAAAAGEVVFVEFAVAGTAETAAHDAAVVADNEAAADGSDDAALTAAAAVVHSCCCLWQIAARTAADNAHVAVDSSACAHLAATGAVDGS